MQGSAAAAPAAATPTAAPAAPASSAAAAPAPPRNLLPFHLMGIFAIEDVECAQGRVENLGLMEIHHSDVAR